ncbi:ParA family protein (plasmid) [Sarcina sp. JB2]|uniref:ParA family protein n=1 Tax=Candidatus Sarcina troglodytae TaxID=2726954 RepID=A0ACD1BGE7_9CLOT|nr:ParA family protein [Sarcina sp. JB2]QPJ86620.1 ParA family protein [Sarcina sp. JB2]
MKTTKVISFFNIKGGIGKTTTTLLTAYQLASSNPNLKILLIDADLQANLTQFIYKTSHEDKTLLDVVNNNLSADELIIKSPNSKYKNIDLIPSDLTLCTLDESLTTKTSRETFFGRWFAKNKHTFNKYDYIFIDLAPSYTLTSKNFLIATDSIIIPVAHGDIASIRGAVLFKQLYIKDLEDIGLDNQADIHLLLTKVETGKKEVLSIFDNYLNKFTDINKLLLHSKIRKTTLVEKSVLYKLSVLDFLKEKKQSNKFKLDFSNLIDELKEKEIL